MVDLGDCRMERCSNRAVIVCRFQSLGIVDVGLPAKRADREVESAWCWPYFAVWTENLRSLARRGWGLGD